MLDEALKLSDKGMPILPADRNGVLLVPANSQGFDASKYSERVREWWQKWPDSLIALPLGAESKIIALRTWPWASPEDLEVIPVTSCLARDVGDNRTLFHLFKWRSGVETYEEYLPGVQVLAAGEHVILPPADTATGKVEWVMRGVPLAEFPQYALEQRRNGGIGADIDLGFDPSEFPVEYVKDAVRSDAESAGFREPRIEDLEWNSYVEKGIAELENVKPDDHVSFGHDFLDDQLTGMMSGETIVVAAKSGSGKTTFVNNIVKKAAKRGVKTLSFSLEDRVEEFVMKSLFYQLNLDAKAEGRNQYHWNLYRRGCYKDSPGFAGHVAAAKAKIASDNVSYAVVKDRLTFRDFLEKIEAESARGVKLFVLDNLGWMDLDEGNSERTKNIDTFLVNLRTVQKKTGAIVIIVVQFKKTNGEMPGMDDIRDSGAIAHAANYIIFLWRDREARNGKDGPGTSLDRFAAATGDRYVKTFFICPKARNPNGEATIIADFDRETGDYVDRVAREPKPLSDMRRRAGAEPAELEGSNLIESFGGKIIDE